MDGLLGGLSQQSLDFAEDLLDRIEVRRVLRQVAQARTGTFDGLLDTAHLVGREVVPDHGVAALERRDQALLDIGQECFAVHRPVDHARSHHAALPQAGGVGHRPGGPPRPGALTRAKKGGMLDDI